MSPQYIHSKKLEFVYWLIATYINCASRASGTLGTDTKILFVVVEKKALHVCGTPRKSVNLVEWWVAVLSNYGGV